MEIKKQEKNRKKALTIMGVSFSDKFFSLVFLSFIFILISFSFSSSSIYDDCSIYGTCSEDNVTNYYNVTGEGGGSGTITGSGSASYIPMWNSSSSITNSNIFQLFNNIGIGTTTPQNLFNVLGAGNITDQFYLEGINVGVDNSVLLQDSDGSVRTDEIDSRVWGSSLTDGTGSAGYVPYWTDANTLSYDSSQLYWNAVSNNLGIGTNSPEQQLDIEHASIPTMYLTSISAEGTGVIGFYDGSDRVLEGKIDYGFANDKMNFYTKGAIKQLTINNVGYLGIGNSSPEERLHISDNSPIILLHDVNGNQIWKIKANNDFRVEDDNTGNHPFTIDQGALDNLIFLTSTGAGIGTATPTNLFNVLGAGNITGNVTSQTDFCIEGGNCLSSVSGGGGSGTLTGAGTYGYIPMWNSTSSINNSNIFKLGNNIGINTTTPQNTLNVQGNANITGNVYSENSYVNGYFAIGTTVPWSRLNIVQYDYNIYEGITFGGGADTGIYEEGDNNLAIGTGGTIAMRLNPTFIRTIDVVPYTDNTYDLGSPTRNWAKLYTNIITDNGTYVGIGTANPQNKLNVVGDVNITNSLILTNSSQSMNIYLNENGTLVFN